MIRRFLENILLKLAVHEHNTAHKKRVLKVMPSRAELDAIEAFRALGAHTDFPARLGQAAQLEAHNVPKTLINVMCKISGSHTVTKETLKQLADHGISIGLGSTYQEFFREAARDVETAGRTIRLQQAVKQLAFIAGPGFTTQHLIDEGMLHEGDI